MATVTQQFFQTAPHDQQAQEDRACFAPGFVIRPDWPSRPIIPGLSGPQTLPAAGSRNSPVSQTQPAVRSVIRLLSPSETNRSVQTSLSPRGVLHSLAPSILSITAICNTLRVESSGSLHKAVAEQAPDPLLHDRQAGESLLRSQCCARRNLGAVGVFDRSSLRAAGRAMNGPIPLPPTHQSSAVGHFRVEPNGFFNVTGPFIAHPAGGPCPGRNCLGRRRLKTPAEVS
jgi:hypothetical protein